MKQVFLQSGEACVMEVPVPQVAKGEVLVQVTYSLISSGTELAGLHSTGESLLDKAWKHPDQVVKAARSLVTRGISETLNRAKARKTPVQTTGYSCSGVVLEVGEGVTDFSEGDRVACAGARVANHAEVVCVPRNLCVKVPERCSLQDAASGTVGSIALQGVRRADNRLGETVAVVGVGLLGQLVCQLLTAAGCRVAVVDVDEQRVTKAVELGAELGVHAGAEDVVERVLWFTGHRGADSVILTAATSSSELVQQAMGMCRKKGKVVVVGAVGMDLQRSPFYEKEIDFLVSCSYGPGRYDPMYEERGLDYPFAYVRWTEHRNIEAYLRLVAEGKVRFEPLIGGMYPLEKAAGAYRALQAQDKPLAVLFDYGLEIEEKPKTWASVVRLRPPKKDGRVRVAVVGAGGFAKSVHLPNLKRLSHLYELAAVVSRTGANAKLTADQFGAGYASTRYEDVLEDPGVDMVLISTPHSQHACMVTQGLNAGKHVFVEKPLCIHEEELKGIEETYQSVAAPQGLMLMVGFNRRFSPAGMRAKRILENRKGPLVMVYRVNAGFLPEDHWIWQEGGRIIGEGCHFIDLMRFFAASEVVDVSVQRLNGTAINMKPDDNVSISIRYADGSMGTLIYTSLGNRASGKERLEVFSDGLGLVIDDFERLEVFGKKSEGWSAKTFEKGQLEELESIAKAIKYGKNSLISMEELSEVTDVTFQVERKFSTCN